MGPQPPYEWLAGSTPSTEPPRPPERLPRPRGRDVGRFIPGERSAVVHPVVAIGPRPNATLGRRTTMRP
jgi:hypothetical protein